MNRHTMLGMAIALWSLGCWGVAQMPAAEAFNAAPARASNGNAGTQLLEVIDTNDFGPGALRVGDLNGDGVLDLLLVQSVYETREITCLTALTVRGDILWQVGTPSRDNTRNYSDLPVQVHDWDGDGAAEVMYIRQAGYIGGNPNYRERADRYEGHATMIVLDGRTGREKKTFALPPPADDSFLFADLTGRGRRQDLVVKDRYWNLWGVSFEGAVLWHWKGSTGHFPAVADVDGDGKDEVFVGYTLINHDGKVLFDRHPSGGSQSPHSDANWIAQLSDGSRVLAFGNSGAHLLTPAGERLWHVDLSEAQHLVAGRFRSDSELQFAILERGMKRTPTDIARLHLVDLAGKRLWTRELPPGSWAVACRELDWSGSGAPAEILVYGLNSLAEHAAIYDGPGNVVDRFAIPWKTEPAKVSGKELAYATRADLLGNGRHEVILYGPRGVCIYSNPRSPLAPAPSTDQGPADALYNETIYTGM